MLTCHRFLYDPEFFGFHLFMDYSTTVAESVFKTGFLGTEYKEKNTITRRWPNRLIHSKSDKPGIEAFDRYLGWFDLLPQRWLEWKRVGDADDVDWRWWSRVVVEITWETMQEEQKRIIEYREELAKSDEENVKSEPEAVDQEQLRKQIEELVLDQEKAVEKEKTEAAKGKKTKKAKKGKKKK